MSNIAYNSETILKLNSTYARACFADEDFSLSDPVGQRFDAWYGGKDWLKAQNILKGTTFYRGCTGGIHVFYLVIKKHNYSKATDTDINNALQNMIDQTDAHGIEKIAFSGIVPVELTINILRTKLDELVTDVDLFIM